MKILFLTKELPFPVNSGARMRTWHYLRGLTQAGRVHMVCYGREEENEEGLRVMRQMGVDVMLEPAAPSWSRRPSMLGRLLVAFLLLPYAVLCRKGNEMAKRMRSLAGESACDVLICDGIHMSPNVPMDSACRKILDEHNVESVIIGRFFNLLRNPLKRLYVLIEWMKFRRFEEKIWPKFDEIHVCSGVDKMLVEKRVGHQNVKVVPNGVDCSDFKEKGERITDNGKDSPCSVLRSPFSDQTSRRLVYSGLMGWQPNEDAALYFAKEIFPLIKSSPSSVLRPPLSLQFYIVGKDPAPAVQKLAKDDPAVTVTGFVDDVKTYIAESDVVVVPLRMGSGTRLKILEAMAMGKAVVSTSIGAEGLEVAHGENIFIADNPQEFAGCVVKLLQDADLRDRIAQAGRRLVEEKYDWQLIESQLAEIFKTL